MILPEKKKSIFQLTQSKTSSMPTDLMKEKLILREYRLRSVKILFFIKYFELTKI